MTASLTQKLQLKSGQRMAVLNAPRGYVADLTARLDSVDVTDQAKDKLDATLVFVNTLAEAKRLAPRGMRAVAPDGLAWVAYPKGSSKVKTDVNRDRLWEALKPTGWRPVRQIALDEIWSAMRFRPADKVGR
jgi:hypothetical protein